MVAAEHQLRQVPEQQPRGALVAERRLDVDRLPSPASMRRAPVCSLTATSANRALPAAGSVAAPSYDARNSPFGSENGDR